MKKKTIVEVYFNNSEFAFSEKEDVKREYIGFYFTDLTGESAAEECFKLTNAPENALNESEKSKLQNLLENCKKNGKRLRSLSVGDVVNVGNFYNLSAWISYLCAGTGWRIIN